MTKLASQLPKNNDDNGLSSLNRALVVEPEEQHLVIMVVDCKKTETETDTGFTEATARVVRCEPIHSPGDRTIVEQILTATADRRTGRLPIPGLGLRTASGVITSEDVDQ